MSDMQSSFQIGQRVYFRVPKHKYNRHPMRRYGHVTEIGRHAGRITVKVYRNGWPAEYAMLPADLTPAPK